MMAVDNITSSRCRPSVDKCESIHSLPRNYVLANGFQHVPAPLLWRKPKVQEIAVSLDMAFSFARTAAESD